MLTDTKAKQSKARTKPYKLADGGGLYLYVTAAGARSWRYDYRLWGKRYTLTLGQYPEVTVGEARDRHALARKAVERGENPSLTKKREKQAASLSAGNTFKALAEAWYSGKTQARSDSWKENTRRWLDKQIYPSIGESPIKEIHAADVLAILKRMEGDKIARSASYVRQLISQVFDYAIANLRADFNPARSVRGAIELPPTKQKKPLSSGDIPGFVDALDAYRGRHETRYGAKLLLLTFVRKSELREATWDELYLDKAEWRIPAKRMKMREDHFVPLSKQAVECFKALKLMAHGSRYVLPHLGNPNKCMGETTLNKIIDRIGYHGKFSPHGVRTTASTILNEQGFRADVIERQLAHTERNTIRAAYNKAEYLPERKAMMQRWADYIDGLCAGDKKVTNIRRVAA
jgi:integrase